MPPIPCAQSIPRFLLPQGGAIWRTRLSRPSLPINTTTLRNASHKTPPKKASPSKSLVLEKPERFNPPSHGSRLPRASPRYPGPRLSDEEKARQRTKTYPHMMPPPGTFMHWFINNKGIHIYITMGTLFGLASTIWVTNFKRNSPFWDMLPTWSHGFLHPIAFCRTLLEVLKLTGDYDTAKAMEKRKRNVEDVVKRAAYRKAHGLDQNEGFGGWTVREDDDPMGPGIPTGDGTLPAKPEEHHEFPVREKKHVKKWLGIW